jgi:hypothetical protein
LVSLFALQAVPGTDCAETADPQIRSRFFVSFPCGLLFHFTIPLPKIRGEVPEKFFGKLNFFEKDCWALGNWHRFLDEQARTEPFASIRPAGREIRGFL